VAVPAAVPGDRSQGPKRPRCPVAEPSALKVTVPDGVVGLPLVSATVAVQLGDWFTITAESQVTDVVVE